MLGVCCGETPTPKRNEHHRRNCAPPQATHAVFVFFIARPTVCMQTAPSSFVCTCVKFRAANAKAFFGVGVTCNMLDPSLSTCNAEWAGFCRCGHRDGAVRPIGRFLCVVARQLWFPCCLPLLPLMEKQAYGGMPLDSISPGGVGFRYRDATSLCAYFRIYRVSCGCFLNQVHVGQVAVKANDNST